jgi:UDP-glucose 4-epimerase
MTPTPQSIFVTGGLGYIGGRCSRFFAKHGYDVKVGSRRAKDLMCPDWLHDGALVPYSTADDVSTLEGHLCGISAIVHLAAPNEIICGQRPEKAITETAIGTLRLCQAAKNAKVKKFVFLSTAHVYRSPLEGEFSELSVAEPIHPYAYSHLVAERIVHSFAGQGIECCVVVRLTNAIGAPERIDVDRWTLLANDLCRQAVQYRKLTIKSDGMGLRDFVSLHDVERALFHLVEQPIPGSFEVFNLGSGSSMRVIDLAAMIAEEASAMLDHKVLIEVMQKPMPADQSSTLKIDVSKLQKTGFVWTHDLRQQIRETIQLCRDAL